MNRKVLMSFALVTALALAGCAGEAVKPGEGADGADAAGAGKDAAARAKALLAKRTVYFDFDSAALTGESREIAEAHARHLAANTNIKLTLEGHCDERGTREYNLGLGERRAQSVEKVMRALGVGANRVKVISYGEEKPANTGHDEAAWAKNRRVEIMY